MSIVKKLVFYSKSVAAVTLLSTCAVYGVLASVVLTLVGKRQYAQWSTARAFYNVVGLFMGVDVEVINAERLEQLPAVFVSNHQSELDILMLGKTFPVGCTMTAKDSLKYVPLLGWFMYLSGTFFLNRSSKEKSVQTLNSALDSLKKNKRAIWIFPEGTRSYTTKLEMLPFKKGAFHLAQQAGIPIVPVVVSNTSTIFNPKLGIFNRGNIVCKVLEPIETTDISKENVSELAERVHKLMSDEYKKIGYSKAIVDTSLPKIATD